MVVCCKTSVFFKKGPQPQCLHDAVSPWLVTIRTVSTLTETFCLSTASRTCSWRHYIENRVHERKSCYTAPSSPHFIWQLGEDTYIRWRKRCVYATSRGLRWSSEFTARFTGTIREISSTIESKGDLHVPPSNEWMSVPLLLGSLRAYYWTSDGEWGSWPTLRKRRSGCGQGSP